MTLQDLQKQALQLPIRDRLRLINFAAMIDRQN